MNPVSDHNARYLIVSADDFGYFRCVSRGILESHLRGIVTATAVFGNSPDLRQFTEEIRAAPDLDIGVHLNLTHGRPLCDSFRSRLRGTKPHFPSKFRLMGMLLAGQISIEDIETEWSMQVERCVQVGLRPSFLNSHEHVHMVPSLFNVVGRIADRFRIEYIRISRPDVPRFRNPLGLLRDAGLWILAPVAECKIGAETNIRFFGTAVSGRLSLQYLQDRIPTLEPGRVYELMCHPGRLDRQEIRDDRLHAYHDWEQELSVLTGNEVRQLMQAYNVRLIGYRDVKDIRRAPVLGFD